MSHLSYRDLIHQTYDFPQLGFDVNKAGNLIWNGVDLLQQVKKASPVKISYLPKIREKIQYANKIFNSAIEKYFYDGNYIYSYCTKSSHFEFVLDQVISEGAQLELSSEFDIEIIEKLAESGKLSKKMLIICNGYKPTGYLTKIINLKRKGYNNIVVILDNKNEVDDLDALLEEGEVCKVGMRVATEDEPNTDIYTSRLGTRSIDILAIYKDKIHNNKKFEFCALHFFINTKIKDTSYYWSELSRITGLYCDLKRFSKTLQYLDIGGGFPMPSSLNFEYDYEYIADQIIWTIKHVCESEEIQVPDIVTEFGTYTVGESGCTIFKVLGQKKQNDKELRYIINSSLITTLPDIRGIDQKFIVLPINGWNNDYEKVIIGGITCDNDDFYNKDAKGNQIILPSFDDEKEDLYIGFFHTGAYQESLGGYGGIQHCLIPAPKHILVDTTDNGGIQVKQFSKQQESKSMLSILGYK